MRRHFCSNCIASQLQILYIVDISNSNISNIMFSLYGDARRQIPMLKASTRKKRTCFSRLVGCLGFKALLRQFFSQKDGERKYDRREKNIKTIATHTYCKQRRSLSYYFSNHKDAPALEVIQRHRMTRSSAPLEFFQQ